MSTAAFQILTGPTGPTVALSGDWTSLTLDEQAIGLRDAVSGVRGSPRLDLAELGRLDTAGAYAILRAIHPAGAPAGGRRAFRRHPPVRAGPADDRGGRRPGAGRFLVVQSVRPYRSQPGGVRPGGLERRRFCRPPHRRDRADDQATEPAARHFAGTGDGNRRHRRLADHHRDELLHRHRRRPGRRQPACLARCRRLHGRAGRGRGAARIRHPVHRHPARRPLGLELRRPDRLDEDEPGNRRHAGDGRRPVRRPRRAAGARPAVDAALADLRRRCSPASPAACWSAGSRWT